MNTLARPFLSAFFAAALISQAPLASHHNHAHDAQNADSQALHVSGQCGHGEGQSHSESHAEHCLVCTQLAAQRHQLPVEVPTLILVSEQLTLRQPTLASQVIQLCEQPRFDLPRGPPLI